MTNEELQIFDLSGSVLIELMGRKVTAGRVAVLKAGDARILRVISDVPRIMQNSHGGLGYVEVVQFYTPQAIFSIVPCHESECAMCLRANRERLPDFVKMMSTSVPAIDLGEPDSSVPF